MDIFTTPSLFKTEVIGIHLNPQKEWLNHIRVLFIIFILNVDDGFIRVSFFVKI